MMILCDFCGALHPESSSTRYTAKDFIYQEAEDNALNVQLSSKGDWGACPPCNKMIVAQDWDGLVDRSVDLLVQDSPHIPREWARAEIALMHWLFREAQLEPRR